MRKIEINNVKGFIPENYDEISYEKFLLLRNDNNILQVLSIMTDIHLELWEGADYNDVVQRVLPFTDWLNERFDFDRLKVLKEIKIKDKTYKIPVDLGKEPIGKFLLCQNIMKDIKEEELLTKGVDIMSIYLCGDEGLKECIMKESCTKIYPVISFFLSKLADLMGGGMRHRKAKLKIMWIHRVWKSLGM